MEKSRPDKKGGIIDVHEQVEYEANDGKRACGTYILQGNDKKVERYFVRT
jgi:hypothetical protein